MNKLLILIFSLIFLANLNVMNSFGQSNCAVKPVGADYTNPFIVNLTPGQTYQDTENNSPANCFGNETFHLTTDDICYQITLNSEAMIRVSNIGTNFVCATGVGNILHGAINIIAESNNDTLVNNVEVANNTVTQLLMPGTYYIYSVAYNTNYGNIVTNITWVAPRNGADMAFPINAGTMAPGSSFTDTENNSPANLFFNDYGQPSDDIFYKFTLTTAAQVGILAAAAGVTMNPYVTLLDANGNVVDYNDDYGPLSATQNASLLENLNPGTYYVVSEGSGTSCGSIATTITVSPAVTVPLVNNYVATNTMRLAGIPTVTAADTTTINTRSQQVIYYDGLGRPNQQVNSQASPDKRDIVIPMAYDQFGREAIKYLPYVATLANSNGTFKITALTDQTSFYANPSSSTWNAPGVDTTSAPYSQTLYEPSPLSRITEQGSPGTTWQPGSNRTTTYGRTVVSNYVENTAQGGIRQVKLYTAVTSGNGYTLTDNGWYGPDSLSVIVTKDENWTAASGKSGLTEEYKDKLGRILLKRVWLTDAVPLSTYYVYDNLDNLAFVLPPGVSPDNGGVTQAMLDNSCYQYRYDGRKRLTQRKIPGKGWEFIVYNTIDQAVMTQDANQRDMATQQWTFTKYDAMGRVIITGILSDTGTGADGNMSAPGTTRFLAFQNLYNTTTNPKWEAPNSTTISGYDGLSDPAGQNFSYLTINYYDGYTFTGQPAAFTKPTGASTMTLGLLTATKTAVLGSSNMLWTVNYYDDLGRIIQSYEQHYLGGSLSANNYDIMASTYDFINEVTATTRKHYNTTSTTTPLVTVTNTYIYDAAGRKKQTWEQINSGLNALLVDNEYNEIGQLMTKNLYGTNLGSNVVVDTTMTVSITSGSKTITATHSITMKPGFSVSSGATFMAQITGYLQTTGYAYNERGWITKINDPAAKLSTTEYFAESLNYNVTQHGTSPQFNGNIAEANYANYNSGTTTTHYSTYNYDALNRLLAGTSSTGNNENSISYDNMGNLTALNRTGASATTLSYSYVNASNVSTGNQLQKVMNGNTSLKVYTYDLNGNVASDGTNNINYNMLNLPQIVSGGSTITYTYDADGNKLRKVSSTQGTTDYIKGIQYKTNSTAIDFIQTEEGRAINNSGSYNYEYTLTDHLGNNRATFDILNGKTSEDDYYPFGLNIPGALQQSPPNLYLYNKKELQQELTEYDYGARFYDPVIARLTSIDPQAIKFAGISPYAYAIDEPVRFIDIYGLGPGDRIKKALTFLGTPYKQQSEWDRNDETYLRTGNTDEALKYDDCSELVCRVLAADGITPKTEAWTTADLVDKLNDDNKFISSNIPKAGDIFLWRNGDHGHTGIVESVDADGTVHTIEAYGTSAGTIQYTRDVSDFVNHKGWEGFFRPKIETPDGKPGMSTKANNTDSNSKRKIKLTIHQNGTKVKLKIDPNSVDQQSFWQLLWNSLKS